MGTKDPGDKGELKARTLCAGVSVAWTVRLSREKVEGNRTSCRSVGFSNAIAAPAIAARYDKLGRNFLAEAREASAIILLN
jgi:hypothetical protein